MSEVRPDHYKGEKEVWEMMIDIWGVDRFITFCEINAFKYRMRAGKKTKDPTVDLEKARWYEGKAEELKRRSTKVYSSKVEYKIVTPVNTTFDV